MKFFSNDYHNKKLYLHKDDTIYIGLYVLEAFEVFKIYLLLPGVYAFINCIMIRHGIVYYRFFEFFLFFILVILLFFAEVSKNNKQLFAFNREGHNVLAFNVCVNLLLIFIVYNFLIYHYMDLVLLYKLLPLGYNAYFASSPVTDLLRLTIGVLFVINVLFSLSYTYFNKKLSYEFFILLAFAYVFLLMCLICRNIFLLLMLIEGLSLSMVGCICFSKNKIAYEVALKFFIISAIFTVIGLFGSLLILVSVHTLDYRNISFVSCFALIDSMNILLPLDRIILLSGVILVVSALFFKLGVFPFHSYVADFCSASVYPLLFFFLGPLKLGIFFILILIYMMFFMYVANFNLMFLFVGLASILVGAKGAVSENELKRFLGFTSINQLGFVILAVSVPGFSALAAAFVFFYIYIITNILFFYIPMQCFDKNNNEAFLYLNHFAYYSKLDEVCFNKAELKVIEEDEESEFSVDPIINELQDNYEEDKSGLDSFIENDIRSSFSYQFRFIVLIFSFIGIPPLPGFAGKYLIFYNLILNDHSFVVFIVMIISLISAYYYLNLIYKLFNKNLTPSFVVNYDYLKFYDNSFLSGFHTFLFWSFILFGIIALDPVFFYYVVLLIKNGL